MEIQSPRRKIGKKSKQPDNRPTRLRYWLKRTLETRKVNHLMRYCGMSKQSAYNFWHRTRKGRVKTGYLDKQTRQIG